MSIHKGHRQRMKERFLRDGLDGFTDIQALELLLFYAIPVKDVNPLAHALLERFGSLDKVLDAPVSKLCEVDGIKDHTAALIKLIKELSRYYEVTKAQNAKVLPTIDDIGDYLKPLFRGRMNETVFLLCLDAKLKVLDLQQVDEGSVNCASVPIRRVVEMALEAGASAVVLAHNHPSGIALPSGEDVQTTRRLAAALSTVDIKLFDHIVVADDDYVSMVLSGHRFDDCVIY